MRKATAAALSSGAVAPIAGNRGAVELSYEIGWLCSALGGGKAYGLDDDPFGPPGGSSRGPGGGWPTETGKGPGDGPEGEALRSLHFPAPRGGGTVHVRYPLTFSAG